MDQLNWIPAVSFNATEKLILYYYSVNCVDHYAIKIELMRSFPGGNIYLP